MATKLVENIDEDVWKRFVGSCVADGVKVGVRLSGVLKQFLEGPRGGRGSR